MSERVQRRKRRRLFFLFIYSLFFIPLFFFFVSRWQMNPEIISPLGELIAVLGRDTRREQLKELAENFLFTGDEAYGIVITNLQTGETYSHNGEKTFEAASLYKLWVMGKAYEDLASNKLTEKQVLKDTVAGLNRKFHIATESAELQEGDIVLSVQDALEKMITVSDNYAALLLAAKVRNRNIASFMKRIGLNKSQLGQPPQTTAIDTARFFEKIYNGILVGSQNMLSLLKRQRLIDRIPKYLPDTIEVAHKTGELGEYKHDAGIVFSENGDYIFVVLSKSKNPLQTAEKIATFSKAVYDYFQERH